jgi:hypothetical protein
MLLAQIPSNVLKKIAAELTVNLKILSVKLSQKPTEEDRFNRAIAVTRFLQQAGEVGSLHEDKSYMQVDAMPMVWGNFSQPSPYWREGGDPGVVLFLGPLGDERVCLSGSLHHVMGAAPKRSLDEGWFPGSFTIPPPNAFMDLFPKSLENANPAVPEHRGPSTIDSVLADFYHRKGSAHFSRADQLSYVARVTHRYTSFDSFWDHEGYGRKIILGSPIWVSLANADTNIKAI